MTEAMRGPPSSTISPKYSPADIVFSTTSRPSSPVMKIFTRPESST